MKKILVLVSNPKGTSNLNLLPEIRDLQEALQRSQHRERFTVEWRIAKHQADLRRYILDVKPSIIHFCGHGTEQGLVLEDDTGTAKVVANEVLTDLLRTFADRIECVLLNACDSENLADALVQHLNYVIGMNQEVRDDAAIAFAEAFYDTLGAGESYERAFEVGKNAVMGKTSSRGINRKATVIGEDGSPVKDQNQEHLIPVLKTNPTPTPIKSLWLSPEVEQEAIGQLLAAIADSFKTISLFHTKEPIVLQDQYIPIQVTLERRYQHTVETIGGYAESEAELKRIYALKGGGEEEIKRQQVDWQTARGHEQRIVVLADPGMGKSTLLRIEVCRTVQESYQALAAGQQESIVLPLLIRLSTLADQVTELSTEEAILKLMRDRHSHLFKHPDNAEVGAFLNQFLQKQLLSGNCLLLLDALDEVPSGKRPQLLERLNEFARSYPTCKIVATSRIVGYGGRLVDGAKDMEIVPFTQPQPEQYIETWFRNAQRSLQDQSVSARGLIQALRERPQLAGLAQNPLLLSLICSLYQRDRLTLPARRSQIYEQAVTCMLGEWSQTRAGHEDDRTEAKMRLLEALAYHFTSEGQEVFDYEDLYDWVEAYLEEGDAPRDLRDDKPGKLIAELSEQDGMLQKLYQDEDQYLFLHRTFQEYFTASYLNRVLRKTPSDGVALVKQHLWNYDWHETLTLLAGLMKKPMVLIAAIAAEKDDIFQTQLLLAGRCIAECSQISDPLIDQLIDRIYQFWQKYPDAEFIQSVVVAIGQTSTKLVQALQTALTHENSDVRRSAAGALGQIGDAKAVDALMQALSDQDSDLRGWAAEVLGQIGNAKAVDALIRLLSDQDSNVRTRAAWALVKIGGEKAVDALSRLLSDQNSNVRERAAEALGQIGDEKAVDALSRLLSDQDSNVRYSAARALVKIGGEKAVDVLMQALSDQDSNVRERAAWALRQIGGEKAVDVLMQALSDQNSNVRGRAAEALGQIGNEKAVDALSRLLSDQDLYVREHAAVALVQIGNATAVDVLIQILDQDTFGGIRRSPVSKAVAALGQLGGEKAMVALFPRLSDIHPRRRNESAEALGKMASAASLETLLQLPNINLDATIFFLARRWAIRFRKAGSRWIPVYPELLPPPATTEVAEA